LAAAGLPWSFVSKDWKTSVNQYDPLSPITRNSFADFLDRFADRKTAEIEWQHFIVRHYGDSFLE